MNAVFMKLAFKIMILILLAYLAIIEIVPKSLEYQSLLLAQNERFNRIISDESNSKDSNGNIHGNKDPMGFDNNYNPKIRIYVEDEKDTPLATLSPQTLYPCPPSSEKCNCPSNENPNVKLCKELLAKKHKINNSSGTMTTDVELIVVPHPQVPKARIQLLRYFQDFAEQWEYNCTDDLKRIGNVGNGGWFICLDKFYKPKSPCLIYSFGIGNDWSFDDTISKLFNCRVDAFDPTIKIKSYARNNGSVNFHAVGLKDVDDDEGQGNDSQSFLKGQDTLLDGSYLSLATIMRRLGHEGKIIDILKMDIETWEWAALHSILTPPTTPSNTASEAKNSSSNIFKNLVKQFVAEFHFYAPQSFVYMRRVLTMLNDNGFKLYRAKANPGCKITQIGTFVHFNCFEFHFVNINFLSTKHKLPYGE